jgi:hypothetical protein
MRSRAPPAGSRFAESYIPFHIHTSDSVRAPLDDAADRHAVAVVFGCHSRALLDAIAALG